MTAEPDPRVSTSKPQDEPYDDLQSCETIIDDNKPEEKKNLADMQ
jgi:hypothetical protein